MALGPVLTIPGPAAMSGTSWGDTYKTATQVSNGLYAASGRWCFTQTAASQAPVVENVDQDGSVRHHSPKRILKSLQQRLLNHVSGALEKFARFARRDQPDPSFAEHNSYDDNVASVPALVPTPPITRAPAPSPATPNFKENMKEAFRGFQFTPRLGRMFSGSMAANLTESESSSESSRQPSKRRQKRPKLRSLPRYSRHPDRARDALENWSRGRPIWIRGFAGNRAEFVYYERRRHQGDMTLMSGANDVSTSPRAASPNSSPPSYAGLPTEGRWYTPQTRWTHVPARHGSLFRHASWPGITTAGASPNSPSVGNASPRPTLLLRPTRSPPRTSASVSGSYLRMFLSRLTASPQSAPPSPHTSLQTPASTSRFVSGFDIFIDELDFETTAADADNDEASRSERDDTPSMHGRRRRAAGRTTSFSGPISLETGSPSDWDGFPGWQPSQSSLVLVSAPLSNGEGPSRPSVVAEGDGSGPRAVGQELSEDDDAVVRRMSQLGIEVNIRRVASRENGVGGGDGDGKE